MEKSRHQGIVVICDAGPLIHLDELDCLNLLDDFNRILIPDSVWREVIHHRPQALDSALPRCERLKRPVSLYPEIEAVATAFALHRGEIDALNISKDHPDAIFLTDDTAARLAARSLKIQAHGTIGILIRAIRRNHLSRNEVIDLLQAIPQRSTLFIKKSLLDDTIARLR